MRHSNNVILDLDNTLISAEAVEDFPFSSPGIRDKSVQFTLHDMDGYYIVFERPCVQEFLDWLFSNYNVSIWTAASKDYALFIIDKVVLARPNRKLDFIFFSYHCDISKRLFSRNSKRLDLLFDVFRVDGYNSKNTIIIDDLKEVYTCQPNNAIHIHPFEILSEKSEQDNVLLSEIKGRIEQRFV
jgi:TFIIF-interacting CTD phosphatase-like protein